MNKQKKFIRFSPPLIGSEEINEVTDTLRSDWITTGPKVERFEGEFCSFTGAPAALAVSSATDAMLVGLATLGIGPGDEVITTPMTFCATVHVIEHLGAKPVLVDVEPDTLKHFPGVGCAGDNAHDTRDHDGPPLWSPLRNGCTDRGCRTA